MRRIFVLCAFLGLMSSLCSGNTLCLTNGTYQYYETNYATFANACSIGDKLFWGFTDNPVTGNEPSASGINVQPIPGDGFSNPGISFNSGGWTADAGFPIDEILDYNVATSAGTPLIEDATLTITGTLTGAGSVANVIETLTPFVPGDPLSASLPGTLSDHITFFSNLQTTFAVQNEIKLSLTTAGATSHVSVVENQFSEAIPEPGIMILTGSGLLLLGIARRKKALR